MEKRKKKGYIFKVDFNRSMEEVAAQTRTSLLLRKKIPPLEAKGFKMIIQVEDGHKSRVITITRISDARKISKLLASCTESARRRSFRSTSKIGVFFLSVGRRKI